MSAPAADYEFAELEPRWQRAWQAAGIHRAGPPDARPKYYVLDMFPYPSGAGLHIGHAENYTITDVMARYKRARGYNVLYPIGWDAFGLPTEQYAVKTGRHPRDVTADNVATFRRQLQALGLSYDFSREVNTTDPRYFRWTQMIFLRLFRRGLAYVDERPVWWCPALGTVLANEEVVDGKSEVGGHPVERRPLRQWVLRITAYADRLLEGLAGLDWPESTKRMQEAWIGRSEGAEIDFPIVGSDAALRVFTTRADTLFGATYLVVAPEHPLLPQLTTEPQRAEVEAYVRAAAAKSDLDRTDLAKEKTGVFAGSFAVNPATGARIPIWVADYVLGSYGTGAIMAVPAHDERDHVFAEKFRLPIVRVVEPLHHAGNGSGNVPFCGEGTLLHSGEFTGLHSAQARHKIAAWLERSGRGRPTINFKLRDWLFSRQRYWGEPFPIVWVAEEDYASIAHTHGAELGLPRETVSCISNGRRLCALPLPESALPLELPEVRSYQPTGTGESPLAAITDWIEIWHEPSSGRAVPASTPRPGPGWVRARRESNTMPQWAGSCWYYLRYCDPTNQTAIAAPETLHYWLAPDLYVGGAEHAVLHLLYARFWHMVLFDEGLVNVPEPFPKLFHQGIILGEDGEKMSKSRGNVVNPDDVIREYGADTLRVYLMFLGPLEASKPWNPRSVEGSYRFLRRLWREVVGHDGALHPKIMEGAEPDPETDRLLHATILKVTADYENLRYNTAVSQLMILLNQIQRAKAVARGTLSTFVRLLAPLAPHIAAELWQRLGNHSLLDTTPWPEADPAKVRTDTVNIVVQVNGKHRGEMTLARDADEAAAREAAFALPKVRELTVGRNVRKIVYVPGRILNLVVG